MEQEIIKRYKGQTNRFAVSLINHFGHGKNLNSFETSCDMVSEACTGSVYNIDLRPGLNVEVYDNYHHLAYQNIFHFTYSTIRLIFYLVGFGEIIGSNGFMKKKARHFAVLGGYCTMAYFPELEGVMRIHRNTRYLQVNVNISSDMLRSFSEKQNSFLPYDIQSIAEGSNLVNFYHIGRITTPMQSALYEILNCPLTGIIRRVFMEGKALELVAYKLDQIQQEETGISHLPKSSIDDIERIKHAKSILINNMENPPLLSDLARQVGISHGKLNAGFRKLYGTTVFGCLQKIRLEHARYLMEKRGLNVTEAAMAVGYNSIPSFSRAFSHHFNISPKNISKI